MPHPNGLDGAADLKADPTVSIITAFKHLAIQNDWKTNSAVYKSQRARLLVDEFSAHFGNNLSNLGGWQAMCRAVDLPIPSSITQCKKHLKSVHVNIFDLIDAARTDQPARTFGNDAELAKYSKKKGKVFPKLVAKQNKLLKFMLRQLY